MPTLFEEIAQGASWEALALVFGETITYNPSGGAPAAVTGIWRPGESLSAYVVDGSQEVLRGVMYLSPADAASPSASDTFTIDGATWAVTDPPVTDVYVAFQLERRIQKTVGGDNQLIKR